MNSINPLKKDLQIAAELKNGAQRAITIAAIVAEALRSIDQDPILVGGAAVEFYTQGGYSTADIDMITEGGPELVKIMEELGFEKIGKDFLHPALKIYIEFPGRSLGPSEKFSAIKIGPRHLRIISVEDLIVDRLCAYKFWKSVLDGVNAMLLLEIGEVETARLQQRAKEEDVLDALEIVQKVMKEVIRRKLSRKEANQMLEQGKMNLKI